MRGWASRCAVVIGLPLVIGCGAGPEPGAADSPAVPAADPAGRLGGGVLTPVHDGAAGSPHVKVDWEVDGAALSLTYGRPHLKGRTVGETVEPLDGAVWRLGADEATTFSTSGDLMVGAVHVPAGEYTLWTLTENGMTHLIVNGETGQWGTAYDPAADLGRTEMRVGTLDTPADQLTLFIENSALRIEWGTMVASVPIMVH